MWGDIVAGAEKQGEQVPEQEEEKDLEQEDQLRLQKESRRKQAQDQGQVCHSGTGLSNARLGGVIDYRLNKVPVRAQVSMMVPKL